MARTALRLLVELTVPLFWSTAVALPAGAASKVGPHQYVTGVINGTDGNTGVPIPIRMGCFGPMSPGQTGTRSPDRPLPSASCSHRPR